MKKNILKKLFIKICKILGYEIIDQADGSKKHDTVRTTTTTKTTPVTTTLTYPKVSIYTYADGHSFTHDATDEIVPTTVDDVVVENSIIKITVSFLSEQFKNNDENTVIKKRDTWTFEKPTKSKNPNWLLSST